MNFQSFATLVGFLSDQGLNIGTIFLIVVLLGIWASIRASQRRTSNSINKLYTMTKAFAAAVSAKLNIQNEFAGDNNWAFLSPANLTETGLKNASEMRAHDTVARFLSPVEDSIPEGATDFEIQEACFDYARNTLIGEVTEDEKEQIHAKAFQNKNGIEDVLMIYGILLRNAVMKKRGKEHPPLPTPSEDVD